MTIRFVFTVSITIASLTILSSLSSKKNHPSSPPSKCDSVAAMDYLELHAKIIHEYPHAKPGQWGQFIKGVDEDLVSQKKIIALTFDACGTRLGNGYDAELIDFLRKEKIPATMFFTGLWIDANPDIFKQLAKDTLFEIENHGYEHKPCAVAGETEYGIKGTLNVGQAVDEIELNNRKIKAVTGRRPLFFRSPTAFCDETCVKVAGQLCITLISYDILSGDAVPYTPTDVIANNILKDARSGAIVIMHMNHPQWYGYEALLKVVPELRKQGYTFVKLDHHRLKGKY